MVIPRVIGEDPVLSQAWRDAVEKVRAAYRTHPMMSALMEQLANQEHRAQAIHQGKLRLRCVIQLVGWNHHTDPNSRRCVECMEAARLALHGHELKKRIKAIKREPVIPVVSPATGGKLQWRCFGHQEVPRKVRDFEPLDFGVLEWKGIPDPPRPSLDQRHGTITISSKHPGPGRYA